MLNLEDSTEYPTPLQADFLESCPEANTGMSRAPVLYLASVSGGLRSSYIGGQVTWTCRVASVHTVFGHSVCTYALSFEVQISPKQAVHKLGELTLHLVTL